MNAFLVKFIVFVLVISYNLSFHSKLTPREFSEMTLHPNGPLVPRFRIDRLDEVVVQNAPADVFCLALHEPFLTEFFINFLDLKEVNITIVIFNTVVNIIPSINWTASRREVQKEEQDCLHSSAVEAVELDYDVCCYHFI